MNREELLAETPRRMGSILGWATAGAVLGVLDSFSLAAFDPVLIGQSASAGPVKTVLLAALFGGAAFFWPLWWGGHGRFFFVLGVVGLAIAIAILMRWRHNRRVPQGGQDDAWRASPSDSGSL